MEEAALFKIGILIEVWGHLGCTMQGIPLLLIVHLCSRPLAKKHLATGGEILTYITWHIS